MQGYYNNLQILVVSKLVVENMNWIIGLQIVRWTVVEYGKIILLELDKHMGKKRSPRIYH